MADSDITVSSLTATAAGPGAIAVMPITGGGSCLPYLALAAVEIWGAATNNRNSAAYLGDTITGYVHGGLPASTTRYYWARPRDVSGNLGDWFPSSSTGGRSATTSSTEIPDGSITAPKIGDGAVTTPKIPNGAVTDAKIGSLAANKITAGTLQVGVVYAGTVAATQITAGTLNANVVYAGTIAASRITAGTFAANVVYGGLVQAEQVDAKSLSAISANLGTVTAGTINGLTINGGLISGSTIRTSGSGARAEIVASTGVIYCYSSSGAVGVAMGGGGTSAAEFNNTANSWCVRATASNSGADAHAIRGQNTGGGHGIVGVSPGGGSWAFYAHKGGYGPFTGSHDAFVAKGSNLRPAVGDIVVDLRVLVRGDIDDTLTEVIASSEPGERGVVGVVSRIGPFDPERTLAALPMDDRRNISPVRRHLAEHYDMAVINGVGEGQVNVCGEGGDIEIGDMIIASSIPGKGMRQPDDIVRGNTVARARERVTFAGPDTIKRAACIYLCG